jgi:hypothetical protein
MDFLKKMFGRKPLPLKQQMVHELLRVAAQAGLKGQYDKDNFSVQFEGGGQSYLENTWAIYQQAPEPNRRQVLVDLVKSLLEASLSIPDDWEKARRKVLPKLRNRSYWTLFRERLAYISKNPAAKASLPPHQPLGDWFGVGLCYDLPSSIRDVEEEHLKSWGVTFEEALQVALDNLALASAHNWGAPRQGLWQGPWDDAYGCCRLLLKDRLQGLKLPGQLIAAIPHRDTLLVAGSEDLKAVEQLLKLAEGEQHHPLSPVPLIYEGGQWLTYQPKGPLAAQVGRLRIIAAAREYEEQKAYLDNDYEHNGQDVFVATFKVYQKESGEFFSVATWTAGVCADLPQADTIAVVQLENQEAKMLGLVDWQAAWPVIGHRLRPSHEWPARYRVESFPSPEELAQLRFI